VPALMEVTRAEPLGLPHAPPAASPWMRRQLKGARPLAIAFCLLPALVVVWLVLVTRGDVWLASAEVFLGMSALLSFGLLRVIPFPSPVHTPLLLFQWWFGVGPAVIGLHTWLTRDYYALGQALGGGATAVLVVGLGLPLYAAGARVVLRAWPKGRMTARALTPTGSTYSRVGMGALLVIWAFSLSVQQVAVIADLEAFDTVNYLGGTQSSAWWLAVTVALTQSGALLLVVLVGRLFIPAVRRTPTEMIVTICIVLSSMGMGLLSGWKGAVMQTPAMIVVAFMMWRRRIPWLALIAVALLYLLVVEPFVSQARTLAQVEQITTPQERTELFKEQLVAGDFSRPGGWDDVNVASPFRGIFDYAGRATARSSLLQGPWGGTTISWGLSTVVPRVFAGAEKRDSTMGNFFDRELGNANSTNSVALSIPFEVLGNWGILAGIAAFAFIGAGWTAFAIFWLTPERLSSHPLMPFFFLVGMGMELSLGSFLAQLRDLSVLLAAFWLLMRWFELPRLHRVAKPQGARGGRVRLHSSMRLWGD